MALVSTLLLAGLDTFSGVIEVRLARDAEFSVTGAQLLTPSSRALVDVAQAARTKAGGVPFDLSRLRIRRHLDVPAHVLRSERLALEARRGKRLPDLASYVRIDVPTRALRDVEALLQQLRANPSVEDAYPVPVLHLTKTADLVPNQSYLRSAPSGVNADATIANPTTRGAGIRIGDVESGWDLAHEDLPRCTSVNDAASNSEVDHGTAVLGEIFGVANGFGITGIAPEAECFVADWSSPKSLFDVPFAMRKLAEQMSEGDVILLEAQVPGPQTPAGDTSCDFGCVPAEFLPAVFDTIEVLTAQGITVVAAAGNGYQNLDDPLYAGYFSRARSSGSILVGAGASLSASKPRARLGFSNYGERVLLQGVGENVTTSGYGPVGSAHARYTNGFGGTSSAAPMVAGAVAVVNGFLIASGNAPLHAEQMAELLVSTGTPQAGSAHIGPLPNLSAALSAFVACGDGHVVAPEVCDDGNRVSGDGCAPDCSSTEVCGNGSLDSVRGEQCDDGNTVSGDGCSATCSNEEICGDGKRGLREVCDDGNSADGDGCSADCKRLEEAGNEGAGESCGNGFTDVGEACDDGNADEHDGCTSTCTEKASVALLPTAKTPGTSIKIDSGEESANGCASSGAAPWWVLVVAFARVRSKRKGL